MFNKKYKFLHHAINDLKATDPFNGKWESTGNDPQFALQSATGDIPTGWVYMEAKLLRKSADFTAKLYFDYGGGFSEGNSLSIPVTRRGFIKHVFKMPKGVKNFRWDPMQSTGIIQQSMIVLSKITQYERIVRMAIWVGLDLWKFRKTGQAKKHGMTITSMLFNLKKTYAASAKLRVHYEPPAYDLYVMNHDSLTEEDIKAIQQHISQFVNKPKISVLLPTYNTPVKFLSKAIESVINQIYPHWELCIADDASSNIEVRQTLEKYQKLDSRINITFRKTNGHISEATNSALSLATGEYVALLDHDDELALQALYHVALEINNHPEADLIYSDEDKIDTDGNRHDPYFKCDWNPDLFYSHNLITHLGVYRKSLVDKIGGFRKGYEGSQDYDLALRFIKNIPHSHIRHIPHILYHWRVIEGSTAMAMSEKDYASDSAKRAFVDHFSDMPGVQIKDGPFPGSYRVQHPLPELLPKVSLLIPTKDGYEILYKCIESIRDKTTYPNWELIILNNQTTDKKTLDYLNELKDDSRIKVINYNKKFNYSSINNYGAKHASGEILGLLNNDVEVINSEWLSEMVSHALRPEIGAVGAKLFYSDGYVQHAGVIIGLGGYAAHAHRLFPRDHPGYLGRAVLIQNFSAVTAACLIVRREIFDSIGGLDEKNLTVAYNDVDLCLRIQEAGYRNLWTPYAELYHYESYTRGQDDSDSEKKARFNAEKNYMLQRWHTDTWLDPYYNPNLTTDKEDFSVTHNPRVSKPWKKFK